jgi:hypothetical protein
MSETIQLVLILCVTYIVTTLINKWNPSRGKHESQQKGGVRL